MQCKLRITAINSFHPGTSKDRVLVLNRLVFTPNMILHAIHRKVKRKWISVKSILSVGSPTFKVG